MRSIYNQSIDIYRCRYRLIICGVLMKNFLSDNDVVEQYLQRINSACYTIEQALDSGDTQDIESCLRNIHNSSDAIYSELVNIEIPEETEALSVVNDFFEL